MSSDRQTATSHGTREQIREAANALFKPKGSVASTDAAVAAPRDASSSERPVPRQPRIIEIPPIGAAGREDSEETTDPRSKLKRRTRKGRITIPAAQHDRVRTLVMYGMTPDAVAHLYGVPVNVIRSIIPDGLDRSSATK